MAPLYALLALLAIMGIYLSLKRRSERDDLSAMIKGVLFQLTRKLQVLIQKRQAEVALSNWRPSFIAISSASISRLAPFDLLRWISHYHGFGSFIHFVKGPLDETHQSEAKVKLEQLINQVTESRAGIYVDTIISPSFKTAVAQIVQLPGIAGMENNSILFEFHEDHPEAISDIIEGCHFASVVDFNMTVLRSSDRHFGYKKRIDIWLTPGDYANANLMILLAYIIIGHPEWKRCKIGLFAAFETSEMDAHVAQLNRLIDEGRIPISKKNVRKIPWDKDKSSYEAQVSLHSEAADLVIMGFSLKKLKKDKGNFFKKFGNVKDILFVKAGQKIVITETDEG
ncbi:MAG: hypothetical protein GTO45_26250 [Candidatus Aminicenantes bacterium]|nr:hypothetical protein [Candidatus Aminicenantes bacterium]NIM82255.1 hypothetical protein [Candidatus Aminicenantes bacterium]NIN21645.1 hypothetical protein [Candidatus Aminicenantes bacterium]NIN88272.1 hypothetical protein [Candidatus Aminicenantes bacterium]NIO84663.1 hypothetical protein [Candidatus Aminicenantes bacterium]